jgi:UDP-2,3-diacylglucosamine pyrophosphatase LpxH
MLIVFLCVTAQEVRADRIQTIHTPQVQRSWRLPKLPKRGPWVSRLGRRVLSILPRGLRHALLRRRADLVVVSDLHLGRGRQDGRYGPLEDFTEDRAFVQFMHYLVKRQRRARRPMKLVLAGDTLDFLKVTKPADNRTQHPDDNTHPSARVGADKMRIIIKGHRRFFNALRLLIKEGHEITVIPGNHDQELNFARVQAVFREAVAPGRGSKRLRFRPWFEVHGTTLIEHGQRYEPMTSLANMLHPFEPGKDGDLRLRSSAANYLVSEMLNHIKLNIPHLNYIPSGRQIFLEVARKRPQEAMALVRFADRTAQRMELKDPVKERTLQLEHNKALRHMASSRSLRRAINRSRRALGMKSLSAERTYALLRRFDNLAAPPHLKRPALGGGFIRRVLHMFRPEEMETWFNPTEGSTYLEGRSFSLAHLANVVVNGHTHSPSHRIMKRAGGRRNHLLDAGTWTPVTLGDGRLEAPMTFVDVRQSGTARLRRWDVQKGRPITQPPAALEVSQFLSE